MTTLTESYFMAMQGLPDVLAARLDELRTEAGR